MAWSRIRGHDSVLQHLLSAHDRGRLAHAHLFVGPSGLGKRLFATELAKALLCERPPAPLSACDLCPACLLVEAGTHPDFFTVATPEDKHELPIAVMREFGRQFAMKASRGLRKVGLILDADDFNEESANCFLKTLEEPPLGSTLILRASSTEQQLATILSRCQVLRFQRLPEAEMRAVLADHGIEDTQKVERLLRLADGIPGQAVALNDDAVWTFRQSMLKSLADPRPNPVAIAAEWMSLIEAAGKETAAQRRRATHLLRLLLDLLLAALRLALGMNTGTFDSQELISLQAYVHHHDADQLATLLEVVTEADYHIQRRVQLVLVIESLMDKICKGERGT